jgi:hypothetical protein
VKLLVDINLSPSWVDRLARHGFEAVHWSTIGAATAPDSEILMWANEHGFVVITACGAFRLCKTNEARCSCRSAASGLTPAALCAAGIGVRAAVAAEQRDNGGERPPFGCALLRPTPGPQGVAHAPHACHHHLPRPRDAGDTAECGACVARVWGTSFALTARASVRFFRETAFI